MKKHMLQPLKKALYSGVFCAGLINDGTSLTIYKNGIDHKIEYVAKNYLASHGIDPQTIPPRLIPDYQQKLEKIKDILLSNMSSNNDLLKESEIVETVQHILTPFAHNMHTVVHESAIESTINTKIAELLAKDTIQIHELSEQDQLELAARSKQCLNDLIKLMTSDKRDYVRQSEIESTVRNHVTVCIKRLKHTQQQATANHDWWQLATPKHTAPIYPDTASTKKIMRFELDDKTLIEAYAQLADLNFTAETLPARVVENFGDAIKKTIESLHKTMADKGRHFVYKEELQTTIKKNLQPIINKIYYADQTCCICLEAYQKGERLGFLSCGHYFHKDCIYPWLTQKQICPVLECKMDGVIVTKQEDIPQ